ncbi:2Fe-2S iron-sulfur cluster-binding protein [Streptomyces sp. NPDC016626]|uniref:(2Fe-2S)-binding protein n=1 Tax=Streptomyces sp. NPDC016626 TaxID=3364968 RepID=UPI0036FC5E53
MTDDQHGQGTPPGGGRWDPLPQGEYDDGATAFVNLPEGGIDALLDAMESPLAAPGHGYVPPQITVTPATAAGTDPAAPGAWAAPVDGVQWHDPQAAEGGATPADRFTYDPGAAGQWAYEETAAENPAPGHDVTGQWSIPVAGGDLPDESGEFTTSALAQQWGGTPPATLPGGAPAPWAPQSIGEPWGPGVPGVPQEQDRPDDGYGLAHQPPAGPDGYGVRSDASAPGWPLGGHAPERPGPADHLPGAGPVPEPSGFPGHAPERPADTAGAGTHGEPDGAGAPGSPSGADPYGGQPADAPAPEPPAGEHAPGGPAHDGPRSSGAPQPYPEPQWQSGAEAADGAPAGLREHPHPGGQDGAEAAFEADGTPVAPEAAEAAPEAAEGPAEPAAAPAPGAEAGTEAPETAETPEVTEALEVTETAEAATGDDAPAAGPGTPGAADGPDPGTESGAPGEPDTSGVPDAPPHDDHPPATYVLRVNGTERPVTDAWIGESLLYVLRERLGLAGAKDGCSQGECGACNVQVDGRLVASCLVPAATAAGSEVRTVEGLAQDGRPSDVQRALARCGAVQCGFCVPGMAMTVHDLLEGNPAPTELETRQALCGNLCRCSGYRGVLDAVQEVVAEREAHSESPGPGQDGEADTPRIPHQAGPGAGGVNLSAFGAPGHRDQPQGRPHDQSQDQSYDQPYDQSHDQSHGQDGGQA